MYCLPCWNRFIEILDKLKVSCSSMCKRSIVVQSPSRRYIRCHRLNGIEVKYLVLVVIGLLTRICYTAGESGGWQGISTNYGSSYGGHEDISLHNSYGNIHQDVSSYGSYDSYGGGGYGLNSGLDHGLYEGHSQHHYGVQAVPISEHVEITKPVPVPVVKNIGVPVAQPVAIPVPRPVAIGIPQPYPVHVPIAKPVAIPVVKTVAVPVEKKVPYPVEKVIPVPVEKAVPITIEKHVPVPVEKPYPIHIPIYKHIFHRIKSHGHGWSH
ncbi:protein SEY1-like [Vespula squamosa]|uniref:Protein SEY1-like n=1 Tax=Vespula squamosa TaxID=30214 RepID=A0ABD2BGP1_VESSQ